MISVESIKEKISRMGHDYRPGNASKPGHLYSPLPFPEFDDIPFQRHAVDERFRLIVSSLPKPFETGRLLDLGCHTGYNCFLFAQRGFECTGVEIDKLTAEIASDVDKLKETNIDFRNQPISIGLLHELGDFQITLFLSTFQWVVLQEGFDEATRILGEIQSRSEVLFFETSMGNEGKMKLPQLPDEDAVRKLLKNSGHHTHVDLIGEIAAPNASDTRYLFRSHSRNSAIPEFRTISLSQLQKLRSKSRIHDPLYMKDNEHFYTRIYRAKNRERGDIALKFVKAKSEDAAKLLYREHEFLAAMGGNGSPALYGFGQCKDEYLLVMSYAEGPTLSQHWESQDTPSPKSAADLVSQLRRIEHLLLESGISHQDIRPDNIILTKEGPVLIDFGWARWSNETLPVPKSLPCPDDSIAWSEIYHRLENPI